MNTSIKRRFELEKYLIDCPQCHSENVSIHSHEFNVDFFVMCDECECRTQMYEKPYELDPMGKAAQDWNNRDNIILYSIGNNRNKNIKRRLNEALINHYVCFNEERFYLDDVTDTGVFIVTTSISDPCPERLCTWIAKFVKRFYGKIYQPVPDWIYVGAWAIPTSTL